MVGTGEAQGTALKLGDGDDRELNTPRDLRKKKRFLEFLQYVLESRNPSAPT